MLTAVWLEETILKRHENDDLSSLLACIINTLREIDEGQLDCDVPMEDFSNIKLCNLPVHHSTASEILRQYLDLLKVASDMEIHERPVDGAAPAESILEALNTKSFDSLSVPQVLDTLNFLCNDCLSSHWAVRNCQKEADEHIKTLKGEQRLYLDNKRKEAKAKAEKEKELAKKNAGKPQRKLFGNEGGSIAALDEEFAKQLARTERDQPRRATRRQSETPMEREARQSLEREEKKRQQEEEEMEKQHQLAEDIYRQELFIRSERFGFDRNHAQYLALQVAPGIFVLGTDGNMHIIRTVAKLDELIESLNQRGIRERVLKTSLKDNYEVMKDQFKAKFRKLNRATSNSAMSIKEDAENAGEDSADAVGGGEAKDRDAAESTADSSAEGDEGAKDTSDSHSDRDTPLPEEPTVADIDYPAHAKDCEEALLHKVRAEIIDFYGKVCEGGFGVKSSDTWMDDVLKANTGAELAACLVAVEADLDHEYMKNEHTDQSLAKFLEGWRESAAAVTNLSQVSLLQWLFSDMIEWEASTSKRSGRLIRARKEKAKVQTTLDGSTTGKSRKKPINLDEFQYQGRRAKVKATAKITRNYNSDDESVEEDDEEEEDSDDSDEAASSSEAEDSDSESEQSASSDEETTEPAPRARKRAKKSKASEPEAVQEKAVDSIFISSSRGGQNKHDLDKCMEIWKMLDRKDEDRWFFYPVDPKDVPTYSDYVKRPMDLQTIKEKMNLMEYVPIACLCYPLGRVLCGLLFQTACFRHVSTILGCLCATLLFRGKSAN